MDDQSPDPERTLEISFERALCSRHGEPFRASWPAGYPVALMQMFELIMEHEGVLRRVKEITGKETPDPKDVALALDEKPACCWLTKDQMLKVYLEASRQSPNFGKKDRCEICGKKRQAGAPYQTSHSHTGHVCFRCVLNRMKPLN